ncbi:MAG TPA: ester cyclase, partial [Actinomycetota bacterium]|nr:ester cyclase [Actinomycetota bacterium]
IYAPDFVSHQHSHPHGPRDVHGREAVKSFVREFREAFPDFHDTVEDQIAEGDTVVTRFTSMGTQKGRLMGIEPTQKHARWMGISIDRIVDGRITENWVSWDMLGMLQQLGAVR